jgi:predicted phage tail protein
VAGNAAPVHPGADPLSETRAVHLGPGTALAEHCGTELLRLDVATPAEAVRAIMLEHPGARQIIEAGQWMIRDGDHLAGGEWDLMAERGNSDIYILPAGEGAGDSGIGKIFAGIGLVIFGLILGPAGGTFLTAFPQVFVGASTYIGIGAAVALSGLSKALAPTPNSDAMALEKADNRQAGLFSHPSVLAQAGEPIPLMYGHSRSGSLRLSSELRNQPRFTSNGTITSGEYVRIVDIVSEGTIEGLSGEAVFVNGDPMSEESDLRLTVLDGSQTGSAVSTPFHRPRVYNAELVGPAVLFADESPVFIKVDDPRVDHVQINITYPQLFATSGASILSTLAVVSIQESDDSTGALINYESPMMFIPWPIFTQPPYGGATPTPTYRTDYGEVSYIANGPSAASAPTLHFGYPFKSGATADGILLRFWVTVFWDSQPAPTSYPYPGVAQEFDVEWRVVTNLVGATPVNFTPWRTKTISIYKTNESATEDIGKSGLIELVASDFAADLHGTSTPLNPASWGWQFRVDAKTTGERPASICIFTFGAEEDTVDYGSPQWWQGNRYAGAVAFESAWENYVPPYRSNAFKSTAGFSVNIVVAAPATGKSIRIANKIVTPAAGSTTKNTPYITGLSEISFYGHSIGLEETAVAITEGTSGLYAGSMANLTYQLKGMKVFIPTGYDPVAGTFASPWDGTFQGNKAYSTDPAWVLFDLLINERYGMGISANRIDKWSFATASRRNISPAPTLEFDGVMGRRYEWNGTISRADDGYKIASQVASSMDAQLWTSTQGLIFLGQDAPQTEISRLITQANVIEGTFSYEGTAVDARTTSAQCTYRDRLSAYDPTIVKEESAFSLARYGDNPAAVDAPGVTIKGQASRRARHILISDEVENQTVRFQIGLENSGIQPGDLIEIADASRSQSQTGSRILSTLSVGSSLYIQCAPNSGIGLGVTGGERVRWLVTAGTIEEGTISSVFASETLKLTPDTAPPGPVSEGAPVIVSTSTPETWRVLEVADDGEGLYTVLAVQHDATKWAAIDDPTEMGTAYTFPADTWPPPGFPS